MKKKGVVLSLINGMVLSTINTTEKAGIYKFAYNRYNGCLVNAFNARLSFSKKALAKADKIAIDQLPTIYHFNYGYNDLSMES